MNLETIFVGAVVVVVTVVAAIGAATQVQRYLPMAERRENNDVVGVAFAIVGVLYAILLTFVTLSVWEDNDAAETSARAEARAVVELRRYAATLPGPGNATLTALADRYVDTVAREEWPRMADGQAVGPAGAAILDDLWRTVDAVVPGAEPAVSRQAEVRTTLRELGQARDARLAATDAGLPGVVWLALLVGAVLALGNTVLFGVKGTVEYLSIVAILSAMSALMLYAVYQLEYPYQRGERITAQVFLDAVGTLTGQ
ncbi:DUF4239 domain-containing protein [Virgisporangium ochraceum]|uniref:bestrophin-like domain n=1 Tax=Virgisporangium ochraceum TaxID=65505 RepID=UPI00194053FE|nr:DUF4239 domain-containing protein [Virgisporangium ochraceum]